MSQTVGTFIDSSSARSFTYAPAPQDKLKPGEPNYKTVSSDVFKPLLQKYEGEGKKAIFKSQQFCGSRVLGRRGTVDSHYRAYDPTEACAEFKKFVVRPKMVLSEWIPY